MMNARKRCPDGNSVGKVVQRICGEVEHRGRIQNIFFLNFLREGAFATVAGFVVAVTIVAVTVTVAVIMIIGVIRSHENIKQ